MSESYQLFGHLLQAQRPPFQATIGTPQRLDSLFISTSRRRASARSDGEHAPPPLFQSMVQALQTTRGGSNNFIKNRGRRGKNGRRTDPILQAETLR